MLKRILPNPALEKCLPNKGAKTYRVNASFLLAIISKLEPQYFNMLVDHATDVRCNVADDATKIKEITIKKTLLDALFLRPFKSRKSISVN